MHWLKTIALLPLCVGVGVLAGIGGHQAYARWSQPAPIERNDYSALLAAHDTDVLLFTTTTCPFCQKARDTLGALRIPYRELAIDRSALAEAAFVALGEHGVPVLISQDRLIRGFQPEAYRDLPAAATAERDGKSAVDSSPRIAR